MYNPHTGGTKIPPVLQEEVRARVLKYANKHYRGKFTRIDVRFKGALCYIDAYREPSEPSRALLKLRHETREEYLEFQRNLPTHLCRLRYLGPFRNVWSLAFYTYSHERYEPCTFHNGTFEGTPEEGFEVGATYLH